MNVAVRNFGATPVRNVSVALAEDGHGRPAVTLAEIPPGKTASEPFAVQFSNAGPHRITARLEADAVAADNYALLRDRRAGRRAGAADRRRCSRPRRPLSRASRWRRASRFARACGRRSKRPRYLSVEAAGRLSGRSTWRTSSGSTSSAVEALEKYVGRRRRRGLLSGRALRREVLQRLPVSQRQGAVSRAA